MFLSTVLANFAATVTGGALLAFIFFFLKEKWFPFPDISGMWFFEMITKETGYEGYEDMKLRYVAIIWREGARIYGTVEKIYEDSSTGRRSYVGQHRSRGTVSGHIQKNYFSTDQLFIHVVETGELRESTNFHSLIYSSRNAMTGTFASMVANQKGEVQWQRDSF